MTKVEIACYDRRILVDTDQVKLHQRKDAILSEVSRLQQSSDFDFLDSPTRNRVLELSYEIIKLNRRIRKNVRFV